MTLPKAVRPIGPQAIGQRADALLERTADRPERLSYAAVRVARAARELSAAFKLLHAEIQALDRGPAGCYIGTGALAQRLGVSRDAVERQRREGLTLGLLVKRERPGRRGATWLATLPAHCVPTSDRPSSAEVQRLAALLDEHVRRHRPGGGNAPRSPFRSANPDEDRPHSLTTPTAATRQPSRTDAARDAAQTRHACRVDAAIPEQLDAAQTRQFLAQTRGTNGDADAAQMDMRRESEGGTEVHPEVGAAEDGASAARSSLAPTSTARPDHDTAALDSQTRTALERWQQRRAEIAGGGQR